MTFLLSRTSAVLGIGLGFGLSLHPSSPFRTANTPSAFKTLQCQYSAPYHRTDSVHAAIETGWGISPDDPAFVKQGRTGRSDWGGGSASGNRVLTARNMRQVSLGSVLGLVAGVGLRAFSKVLVVLLGMGIVLVEWAASKGYNLVPFNRLQRYVKNTNIQRTMSRNVPLKMSFGITMTLAAFAQFY